MDTSKRAITIAYCGAAVDNGTMDVRDLAPALLAFSDFIADANKVINQDSSQISVRVNADFHQGSFEIQLAVIKTLAQQIQELWDSSGVDAGGILALLGLGVAASDCGLIDLIKRVGGRVVKSITESKEQPGKSLISFEGDNNIVVVDSKVAQLYRDTNTRKNIEKVLSPLGRDGIDAFEIRNAGESEIVKRVSKDERKYFKAPEGSEDMTNVSTQVVWVKILNISFEGLKWKLLLGDAKIRATINDEDFKARVDKRRVQFGKGDMLKVVLETTQNINGGGDIVSQYAVLEVKEIRRPKEETELPFSV